jgi:hypothetical protein
MPHNRRFSVGSISVGLFGCREEDVELVPTLEPFRVKGGKSDIDVRIEWVPYLRQTVKGHLFDSGSTWRLYENDVGFQFEVSAPALGDGPYKRLLVDRYFRSAQLQASQEAFAIWPWPMRGLDYPLDELLIMHRLTQEKAIEFHACGIVSDNGVGNLFVGHSGAGKSTTTRLWTARENVEILSDDRIIVRLGWPLSRNSCQDSDESTRAKGHRSVVRGSREPYPGSQPSRYSRKYRTSHNLTMYGTPWHGEEMYASPNNALLSRIFILEHGQGNTLTALSKNQAVAELFARSFVPFHRHEYVESALAFLEEVAAMVPVYRYAFEPTDRAVDTILNFRD